MTGTFMLIMALGIFIAAIAIMILETLLDKANDIAFLAVVIFGAIVTVAGFVIAVNRGEFYW